MKGFWPQLYTCDYEHVRKTKPGTPSFKVTMTERKDRSPMIPLIWQCTFLVQGVAGACMVINVTQSVKMSGL